MTTTQIDLSRQARFTTGDLSINSNRLTNLADPVSAQDAATKAYVDSVAVGLDFKNSCRVATTANISISAAPSSIDGVTLASGDRILLKDQTTASENGIRVFTSAGANLLRATDADSNAEVTSGMFTFVSEGTSNQNTGWVLSTIDTIVLDTTALTFVKFSAVNLNSSTLAGNGLQASGSQLQVKNNGSTIDVSSSGIKVATGSIANNEIATGAAISLNKLASGSSGQIIVANISGVPTYVSSSGDVTVDNTGNFSIGSAKVKATQLDKRKESRTGSTSSTWALSGVPASDTYLDLYLNGQYLTLTADYSRTSSTITFVSSIVSTDVVTAVYFV